MLSGKIRQVLYLLIALAMLVYALPRLELDAPWSLMSVFGLVWMVFALVIIAAHVNALLMSDEKRKELARIKKAKARLWERKLLQKETNSRRARG
ncbi:hypothetical protein BK133_09440 [Paenibacillus sp. FSL H8-0548]|uniref:hypothetical protein n=1 Tax=Paenibacillus sp. FSL H8-0548 TaxID=1920422 RepID=UPI00096C864F|nr:hypothetical protein [Paenibacillus sp. FSL H8-0548]OMF35908.1 hypothetical protein BK133_09440 [Paenibacillus sp. FSL H8-0548]